jgi:O-antigen ligase
MATSAVRPGRAGAAAIIERSPGLVPTAIACVALVWFGGDEGGFRGTTWMPATLLLGAVLVVCLAALPRPRPSRAGLAALLLLGAYGIWSLLSVLWADQPDLAWNAGDRTLLYAIVLALCSLWPLRGAAAAVVLGGLGLGIAGIALVELLKVQGAEQGIQYFHEARFSEPVGYANANVALWMLGMIPCAILAGRRGPPAPLRGLFLGAACLLAGAALLGQSRGWLIALPIVGLIAILAVPGRGRTIVALTAVGAGLLVALDPLLDVYSTWRALRPPGDSYDTALRALLLASAGLVVVGTLAALLDGRVRLSEGTARRVSAGVVVAVAAVVLVGAVGYAVVKRNPVSEVSDKWDEFKQGGSGPQDVSGRFSGGVSTYRYDYWRVAWDEFERAPVLGAGADNFGRTYARVGKSDQTPRYPHSTVLAALAETGFIGGLLMVGAFVAALAAALPALRRPDLAGAAAGAGVLMFGYWLVHGSLDWFWEFPGLAGPALAGLGVAIGVARGREEDPEERSALLGGRRTVAIAAGVALLLIAIVSPPWLSEREQRRGTELASVDPEAAVDRLDRAAQLNPLAPTPDKAAAIVEIRRGRDRAAEEHLREAFDRDSGDSGIYLLLGAVVSQDGRSAEAERLIGRARELAPRDPVTGQALRALRRGGKLDPRRLDRWIQRDVQVRIGPE